LANRIEIIIDGDNIKAVNAISGVETKLKGLDSQSKKSGSVMDSVFGSLSNKVAFGAAAVVTGFGLMIKGAIDLGDEINDLSKKSGMSAENLSTMKYAAELSGSSFEQLGSLVIKLNKNIYEAGSGNKELAKTFYQLGVPVKDAQGKFIQTDQALYAIADRFKSMPDGAQKTALAIQIFGKAGADMIPMLNEGSAGMIKMQEEARALGLEISQKTAAQMDEFKDKLTKVEGSFKGLAISLVTNFGPVIIKVLTSFADGLDVVFGKIQLIGGVQYKELVMGFATANELSKDLIGSTQKYRDEQIKIKQNQLNIEKSVQESAEYALKEAEAKLAFSMLYQDEVNQAAQIVRLGKTRIGQLTQQIELIKKFGEQKPPKITVTDPASIAALKKLKEEEASFLKSWNDSIFKSSIEGLDDLTKGFLEAEHKYDEARKRFGNKPLFDKTLLKDQASVVMSIYNKMGIDVTSIDDIMTRKMHQNSVERVDKIRDEMDAIMALWLTALEYKAELVTREQDIELAKLDYIANIFGSMSEIANIFYSTGGEMAETAFRTYQAFSIAQAMVSTYASASAAFMPPPIGVGPVLGPWLAASVIASGLARVASIIAMRPGSTGGGGGGSSSQPALPSARSIQNNNSTTNNNARNITINITSSGGFGSSVDKEVRERLAPAIKRAIQDGVFDFG